MASTKKISSAGINSSGDVKGTTGTYSSTVTLSVLNISPSTIDTVTNNTIDFKSSYMNIVTSTGTDTLETINGGLTDGNMLIIVIAYSNSLFIKAATGNIWDDNHTISAYGTAMFIYNSTIGMWISID
ncbi:MAG: hypothetical protein EHM12_11115 [Dehalococcoidia bacterium]|nr:MAG: hypothetical protein EHM12_11115 [Dehalococcoidia bacterium]